MPVTPPSAAATSPGVSWSALDFITSALRLIGVKGSGEIPDGTEQNDCIAVFNQMVDSWNADKPTIYTINRVTVVPASLKQAYTLGSGADFDTPRPARIQRISVLNLSNASSPLELPLDPLTDDEWAAIPVKNVSSSLPRQVWDDGGFPYRTLSFFPIPSVQVNFVIYGWNPLTIFPDLSSKYSFPPGYARALRFNLAVELAAEFGTQVPATVAQIAMKSLAILKANNLSLPKLQCDSALVGEGSGGGYYNWLTDDAGR